MWRFRQLLPLKHVMLCGGVLAYLACSLPVWALEAAPPNQDEPAVRGKALYKQACLLCHGKTGKGNGPDAFYFGAYSAPRPRDFTGVEFKFRSTASGELPTDADLFQTITNGIPGFMPAFRGLSETDRWDIVRYLRSFSTLYQETVSTPIVLPPGPLPATPESVTRGQEVYRVLDCAECHGPQAARLGGLVAQGELRDRRDLPILPPDLSQPSSFKNGHRPQDIAKSILTGLDGTPMASFRETLSTQPEDIWHLVNYLLSLSRSP